MSWLRLAAVPVRLVANTTGGWPTSGRPVRARRSPVLGAGVVRPCDAALTEQGLPADNVIMAGDDLEADVHGAQGAWPGGAPARAGALDHGTLASIESLPDAVVGDVGDLPGLLVS
jgi:hypothetical protein